MHYAIVKCERVQKEWYYKKKDSYWKDDVYKGLNKYIEEESDYMKKVYLESLGRAESYWREEIENRLGTYVNHIKNGQCILWEGEVNQERLRITDNLYIPKLDKYLEINKVETTPDGKITYYVNYTKVFYDTSEKSRLKSIEEWMTNEYQEVDKFEELKEYKDIPSKYRKEYEDYLKYKESLLNGSKSKDELVDNLIAKYEKSDEDNSYTIEFKKEVEIDTDDLNWQNIVMISILGFFGLITFMILVSILN